MGLVVYGDRCLPYSVTTMLRLVQDYIHRQSGQDGLLIRTFAAAHTTNKCITVCRLKESSG